MSDVWLGLGSNLGHKRLNLSRAVNLLRQSCRVVCCSSLYRTEPVGYLDQDWFLNAAAHVATDSEPREFLSRIQAIERQLGRQRNIANGPRLIDIDILIWDDLILHETGLTIPHPRLHHRYFVLAPLSEIAPGLLHPVLRKTVSELTDGLPDRSGVVLHQAGWCEIQADDSQDPL